MGLFDHIANRVIAFGARRPDFVVGADNPGGAYLRRWFLIPRNRWFNVYLHEFLRDDDDSALHDHPWAWCSLLLRGGYTEHTIAAGGIHRRRDRHAPSVKFSLPSRAHRVELFKAALVRPPNFPHTIHDDYATPRPLSCWTLFITGPRVRRWGFHCPERGWVDFEAFLDPKDSGRIGKGCDA